TKFVENACCEFDVESLRPTYRLLIGIPGKSNAFAISKKLGLSDEIIEAAKEQITEEKESFEDLIATLENNRITLEKDREEVDAAKARIEGLERDLRNRLDKVTESKEKIIREANEEARLILQEAKDYADETIRIMNKTGGGISMKELEAKRSEVRGKISQKNEKLSVKQKEVSGGLDPDKIKKGDSVRVLSMGVKGIVNTLPDAKGNLYVQCGILRSQVNIKDLELIDEAEVFTEGSKFKGGNTSKIRMSKSFAVPTEINLLGKRVDEAIAELDKYLDDAYLAHLPSVRIVHGKGTGALRSAVQNLLKKNKSVKSYRLGEHGEGDAGVTIAEFK
ncbi:MAG: Smr/MutS family protein, partial [Lachnospiraceae bacterium]|nr:Smr/MutS family protein [Lachnospiraceae bacterium]